MPDIPVWPECDIGCVFCSNPTEGFRGTSERYTLAEFRRNWELYRAGQPTYLKFDHARDFCSLTGGEPTLHPNFLKILRGLRRDMPGRRIRLLTNGRQFAKKEFASACLKVGSVPFEIAMPLFGPDAASHDSIARAPGSFDLTVRGLDHLMRERRSGQRIEARVILHRLQLRFLDGLLDWLCRRFPDMDAVEFLFVEIEGHAERNWKHLRTTMTECALALDRSWERLRRLRGFRLLHFPYCVVPQRLWPHVRSTLDPIKVAFPKKCGDCGMRKSCVGVHISYGKHVGVKEFAPIRLK